MISEDQLKIWAKHKTAAIQQSQETYCSIRGVLESYTYNGSKNIEIYLQGSYANDTNVCGESDIDIVICYKNVELGDISKLPEIQKNFYRNSFINATYDYNNFKQDILSVLSKHYGNDVSEGNKALNIAGNSNRRSADVIPTIVFKDYHYFTSNDNHNADEGIYFEDRSRKAIINYPKQHKSNLTKKHQDTNNNFKPIIRIFKNMRNRMIKDGIISDDLAPSYYIENWLYNAPNEVFKSNYQESLSNIFSYFAKIENENNEKHKDFICANQKAKLFNDLKLNSWDKSNYSKFLISSANFFATSDL